VIEEIDQTRLRIAHAIGLSVFGLQENPREEEWRAIMGKVKQLQIYPTLNIKDLRRQRSLYLKPLRNSVVSAQHWLDYTYGVERISGETLGDAIGRTPTYQERSYPQDRYIHEDIPTGLVPMESLAERLGISHEAITQIIDLYQNVTGKDPRETGRNLALFETQYLKRYLLGRLQSNRSFYEKMLHSNDLGKRPSHPGNIQGLSHRP